MSDPEVCSVSPRLPDGTVTKTTAKNDLELIVAEAVVLDTQQDFVADLQ
jgi:hypothetical protein